MDNLFLGMAILFFGGLFTLLIKNQKLKVTIVALCAVISSVFCLKSAFSALFIQNSKAVFSLEPIFQNVTFCLDNLSAFFVIVISLMSTLGIIYSKGYLSSYIEEGKSLSAHCVFLPLLCASMLGVVTVQNALLFLIIWEVMSLSSFFLVIFENDKKEVLKAGIKYLVYMHVSVVFIILAFAILSINASSFDFAYFGNVLENNADLYTLVFIFAFIGFGIKAGFVPFHNWLPDAHPCAPSHVSAIMSGVMIKTGIYGILRMIAINPHPEVFLGVFVLVISSISALYGVLYAISQHDIKRLLAYHSIENIGIIGMGIGIGMLGLAYNSPLVCLMGFSGAILHVLNHSIFKELLFLGAGAVYTKAHTRDIEVMGGLIKSMPKTAVLFLIGSIAICGLPPFNGFISEFLIYFGMLWGLKIDNFATFIIFLLAIASLALVGTMAILCFTKAFSIIFLGEARSENVSEVKEDVNGIFLFPMSILGIFCLLIGLLPEQIFNFIVKPVSLFTQEIPSFVVCPVLKIISICAFSIIALTIILFIIKQKIWGKYTTNSTWGCGYNRYNPKMQYSASSYASPFIKMLTPLFKRVIDIKKPKAIFEKDAHYSLHMEDVEEAYFLEPFIHSIEKFFAGFERIQDGNIQSYIMYGLIFLIIALSGVVILG